jgi:glycine betaine transporter
VLISIINSVDSAIFVLGMFSDNGNENPSKRHKLDGDLSLQQLHSDLQPLGPVSYLMGLVIY